jgi:hypothetical protein
MKINRLLIAPLLGFSLLTTSALACDHGDNKGQTSGWSFFGWCHHHDDDNDHHDRDHDKGHDCDHDKGHNGGSGSGGSTGSSGSGSTGGGSSQPCGKGTCS